MNYFKYKLLIVILITVLSCKQEEKISVVDSVISNNESKTEVIIEKDKKFILDNLLQYDSEEALKKAFKGKVKRVKGYYPEGMGEFMKTVVFPNTKNEVEFIWKDDSLHFNGLIQVKVYKDSTDWKTKEGITIGTDLRTLEKLNKKPFSFYGFEWDYGGMTNWDNGSLLNRNMSVYLALPETVDFSDYEKLLGDSQFKSNSKIAQKVNPTVSELSLIKK